MFVFPIISLIALIVLYKIHRKVFFVTLGIESVFYAVGIYYIESTFLLATNLMLYYLALTGAGLVMTIAAFFIAISLNHKHLYTDHE